MLKISTQLEQVDLVSGGFNKVFKDIENRILKYGALTVGVHEDAQPYTYEDGSLQSAVEVAYYMEYGNKNFDGYMWLSKSLEQERSYINQQVEQISIDHWHDNIGYINAMRVLGDSLVNRVIDNVEGNTIGLHNNNTDTPAIDTGHMLNQVDYKVGD